MCQQILNFQRYLIKFFTHQRTQSTTQNNLNLAENWFSKQLGVTFYDFFDFLIWLIENIFFSQKIISEMKAEWMMQWSIPKSIILFLKEILKDQQNYNIENWWLLLQHIDHYIAKGFYTSIGKIQSVNQFVLHKLRVILIKFQLNFMKD